MLADVGGRSLGPDQKRSTVDRHLSNESSNAAAVATSGESYDEINSIEGRACDARRYELCPLIA